MKISTFELKSTAAALMRTEILYSVASARAMGDEIVELVFKTDDEKSGKCAVKVVKELKKQGKIKVFSLAKDIEGQSKESEYLLNKYPDLKNYSDKTESIIVML